MTTVEVVRQLEAAGGSIRLDAGEVKVKLPPHATGLLPKLREHKAEIAELLSADVRRWDAIFHLWTQARCAWRERSWGAVSSLYVDHIAWAHQTGQDFAPDRETFTAILESLSFAITDDMVYGLLLKEDAEAAYWKPEQVKPPAPQNRRKGWPS